MKTTTQVWKKAVQFILAITLLAGATLSLSAASTWSGAADPDFNWSAGNWDAAPAATGGSLIFAGSTGLLNTNDFVTSLGSGSFTFASGAGSFVLSGSAITVGNGSANDNIITNASANNQEIALNLSLAGGGRDRMIVMSGGGSLTLSGNINYANDWLYPTVAAGTIIITGNNSGDGKGSVIVAGSNQMRAMMRNNVANTQLILGSDTALGNSGSGDVGAVTANFRGVVADQQLYLATINGDRNLAGSTFGINANWIDFNGANNLTIGNLISRGGNRDFKVSSTGQVTVSGSLSLSADQTGRSLYLNLSGAGGMVVDGKIYDTFHSGGVTAGTSTLRKAGTGMLTLNGDSSYTGLTTVEGGILKIGHANALGATGSASGTTLTGNATIDLNGFTIGESLTNNNNGNKLVNSSASAAGLTADAMLNSDLTVDATGDISATRLIGNNIRVVTKIGAGTLTTSGTSHNNLTAWQINDGTVVFANTSGYGADRGVTIGGGTLLLSGANFDLINNGQAFTVNSGVFDLNGKNEAVASVGGSGGVIRNGAGATATLYVGGGASGTSSASYDGVIENGVGTLKLTKEGSGTQTLTGASTYTGNTTISAGTLALTGSASIAGTPVIAVAGGATFDVSGLSSPFTLDLGQTLAGNGTVAGNVTVNGTLSPGASVGILSFNNNLTLAGTNFIELNKDLSPAQSNDVVNVAGTLVYGGTLVATNIGATPLVAGDTFRIFPAGCTGSVAVQGETGDPNLAFSFSDGVLSVVSTGSPTLNYTNLGGGVLQFGWTGAYKLVWQTNALSVGLSNNWVDYPDASNPVNVTIDPAIPSVFFGLQPTP